MNVTLEQLGIEHLGTSDRMELIGLLWDSITDSDPNAPVPEWHLEEVARRCAAADANPESLVPWEEAKARLFGSP